MRNLLCLCAFVMLLPGCAMKFGLDFQNPAAGARSRYSYTVPHDYRTTTEVISAKILECGDFEQGMKIEPAYNPINKTGQIYIYHTAGFTNEHSNNVAYFSIREQADGSSLVEAFSHFPNREPFLRWTEEYAKGNAKCFKDALAEGLVRPD